VIEVLESTRIDADVLQACRRLRERGYLIAADDICRADQSPALLELVDFIKVDFRIASPAEQAKIVGKYGGRKARMLAEKVETRAEFERARQLGYSLFQGYFFARPVVLRGKELPGFKLNYLRILSEVQKPELQFPVLERYMQQEVSVAYKLLRYANSALFAQRATIDSIRRALVILGEAEIRKWVSVMLLISLAEDKPNALAMHAVVRAAFCESLAQLSGMGGRKSEIFLLGLFSLLDAMIDRPLRDALKDIHLAPDIRETLLAEHLPAHMPGTIYLLAQAYERGDWAQVVDCAARLRIEETEIRNAYVAAVSWCDQVFGLCVAAGPPVHSEASLAPALR
jgi:EAL and modified HD-GYP domain-containing signal transduction protein